MKAHDPPGARATHVELLTVEEAAQILSLNKQTIRKRCRDGQIPNAYKPTGGREWRIPARDILPKGKYK
jgi:excisionase family DNA binding protein